MSFKCTVLSIDGGGIRGIIPAVILAEIENLAISRRANSGIFSSNKGFRHFYGLYKSRTGFNSIIAEVHLQTASQAVLG